MDLPGVPLVKPMVARLASEVPPAGDVIYEPKWDLRPAAFLAGAAR